MRLSAYKSLMEIRHFIALMICLWTGFVHADCGRENPVDFKNNDGKTPSAVVSDPNYVFQPVVEGTQILHDFVIQNAGDGMLIIRKVGAG